MRRRLEESGIVRVRPDRIALRLWTLTLNMLTRWRIFPIQMRDTMALEGLSQLLNTIKVVQQTSMRNLAIEVCC